MTWLVRAFAVMNRAVHPLHTNTSHLSVPLALGREGGGAG